MTPEIGSLRALKNGDSQYVGSSSGVYFINTVRRAFATTPDAESEERQHASENGEHLLNDPSPEDCIVGGDEQAGRNMVDAGASGEAGITQTNDQRQPAAASPSFDLSKLPDYAIARQLVLTYFRIWHPLVPFLHGPECLSQLDALYHDTSTTPLSRLVTFKCIFNIACLESDNIPDLSSISIRSASDLLPTLGLLALRCDIPSIQALLAAQVYFISTMSLRHASSVGGLISRSIFQTGMHRCPFRYWHLSPEDRDMRKRIFWSFYVLDRFLSQSLGHPNGIQDSDIDVCAPGHRDLHEPVAQSVLSPSSAAAADNLILHLPANHPDRRLASPRLRAQSRDPSPEESADLGRNPSESPSGPSRRTAAILQHRRETQSVLENHVRYSQLVGRLLEIFHKSIPDRRADDQTVLFLKADVSAWGNGLTQPRLDPGTKQENPELTPEPTVFPFVLYHYCVLLLNRPTLSLDTSSAEFRAGLQVCIGAASSIIETVGKYSDLGGPLFWPGYMTAVWMSGLILALATWLQSYSPAKAISGISSALGLLTAMTNRWRMAKDCKEVLSMLLRSIEVKTRERKRFRPEGDVESGYSGRPAHSGRSSSIGPGSTKRRATNSPRTRLRSEAQPPPQLPSRALRGSSNARNPSTAHSPLPRSSLRNGPDTRHDNFPRNDHYNPDTPSHDPNDYQSATGLYDSFQFDALTSLPDLSMPNSERVLGPYHAPIPTTFPDRRQNFDQNLGQFDGADMIFDMFDGATWGSLIDMVNDAGMSKHIE
ncbi:Fungal-trans domain-containing protein [Fusarium sp. Ph1]|nr:Fungal-trans domain-containing protein [Fusarium sp. Ph1]